MSEVYYTGYLAADRERPHRLRGSECACSKCARAAEVAAIADARWQAYRRGEVLLVQRRLGELRYEYIAVPMRRAA